MRARGGQRVAGRQLGDRYLAGVGTAVGSRIVPGSAVRRRRCRRRRGRRSCAPRGATEAEGPSDLEDGGPIGDGDHRRPAVAVDRDLGVGELGGHPDPVVERRHGHRELAPLVEQLGRPCDRLLDLLGRAVGRQRGGSSATNLNEPSSSRSISKTISARSDSPPTRRSMVASTTAPSSSHTAPWRRSPSMCNRPVFRVAPRSRSTSDKVNVSSVPSRPENVISDRSATPACHPLPRNSRRHRRVCSPGAARSRQDLASCAATGRES